MTTPGPVDRPVDWLVPEPRAGWRGVLDRFVGPGQTRAEVLVQVVGVPLAAAVLLLVSREPLAGLGPAGVVALVVFAVDGVGGVLTNSTGTAKRWYHRPGASRRERLGFVLAHVVHVALLAWLVLADPRWFVVLTTVLVVGAVVVELTPLEIKRPVAAAVVVVVVPLVDHLAPVPTGLEWLALVVLAKLLVAHLVPEAPFRSVRRDPRLRPA